MCAVLGLENTTQAMTRVDAADRNTLTSNEGMRGNPNRTIVNESGLYDLILDSRKPEARAFRRWVTSEVLPSIRKTGSYAGSTDNLVIAQAMLNELVAQRDAVRALESRQGVTEAKVSAIEGEYDSFTALGFAKLHGLATDRPYLSRLGKRAAKLMRAEGKEPGNRQDATFGSVHVYPAPYLDRAADEI